MSEFQACGEGYAQALATERRKFEDCVDVHDLPPIFHYWSTRYLRPKLLALGFNDSEDLFRRELDGLCRASGSARFVSVGSGNCDLEIRLARQLCTLGHTNFRIDCVDLNPVMLARGRSEAEQSGLAEYLEFVEADFNTWNAAAEYDAVIANQSLHHVVNLEGLCDEIRRALRPGGRFLISDMIGRNGHQRWPEALAIVHEFWRKLPPSYRYNRALRRYEEMFQNFDCSREGFEGIRSQDILPLLVDRFQFHLFVGYGNVIDPFIDRSFGPNFDPSFQADRDFIDQVHERDEAELAACRIKPTHLIAVAANEPGGSLDAQSAAARNVRVPDLSVNAVPGDTEFYDWGHWPRRALEEDVANRTAWALGLEKQLEERTAWALSLQKDLSLHEELAHRFQAESQERTQWALELQSELSECRIYAQKLAAESARHAAHAEKLKSELRGYLRNPFRFAARFAAGLSRRLRRDGNRL